MRRQGEIIIIEDDEDDRAFLKDIFESLGYPNKIVFFEDPTEVISYLSDPKVNPFIVISDINMPKIDGYELRTQIMQLDEINKKCVPYIFLSTSMNPENVAKAFNLSVHGYFKKEDDFSTYKDMIKGIVDYWRTSLTPTTTF